MTWMQTHSGRAFDLVNPRPEDVHINDIAHALGIISRYGGHTRVPYSVAEHCCHVSDYLAEQYPERPSLALAGLLHDAAEAYVGDIIWPVYQTLSPEARRELKDIQERAWGAIRVALAVPAVVDIHDPLVRDADVRILLDERRHMLTEPPPMAWNCEGLKPLDAFIRGLAPKYASREWMGRFERLMASVGGA